MPTLVVYTFDETPRELPNVTRLTLDERDSVLEVRSDEGEDEFVFADIDFIKVKH